jgi:predicted signal transduction protein with EAL and GGDEF domain
MEPTTQSVAALVARNEELQAELAHYKQLALYDSLTGLLNKRGFDEELRRTVSVIFRTMENTQRRLGRSYAADWYRLYYRWYRLGLFQTNQR